MRLSEIDRILVNIKKNEIYDKEEFLKIFACVEIIFSRLQIAEEALEIIGNGETPRNGPLDIKKFALAQLKQLRGEE